MKKRRLIAFAVGILMLLQLLTAGGLTLSVGAETVERVLYETAFDSGSFDSMVASGLWAYENYTPQQNQNLPAPTVENGVMKMNTNTKSIQFNWTKVQGVGDYSVNNQYTFEFDVKITDSGNGFSWSGSSHTRLLYVAPGGYYNQIELNNKDSVIRAGDNYTAQYSDSAYNGKTLHCKVAIAGEVITSTVYDSEGTVITTGSRTSGDYTNVAAGSKMSYMVLRCEDGAVEIDNFKFSVEGAKPAGTVSSTDLSIPDGKQAVYECKINYKSGETSSVKLGNTEIFSISNSGIKLCNAAVGGVYGVGEYGVKAYINPTQKMVSVEVTLPDGGVLRRGTYEMLGGNTVNVLSPEADNVSEVQVNYADITVKNYQMVEVEPTYTGFQANVYNLITSFDDACTTRNFAWTAKASFIGNAAMAIKYRVDGTNEWTTVDAVKAVEKTAIASEDYFKAELKNLLPDTEYEYKIGKKDSSDEKNDWSRSYYFTTAKENVTDFTFVAIGDTQALSWNGDTPTGRGAKYTELAIRAAMNSVEAPAFILHTGDVVNGASYLNHWNWYFKALGNYGAVIPQFTAIGNHDTLTDNQNNYFSLHFNHPDNGANAIDKTIAGQVTTNYAQVLVNNPEETVYSYNYGDVHFIVLNSGTYSNDDQYIIKAQREWLIADLEANKDAKWTVVMVHEAVYHRSLDSEDRPWLYDVIEGYGVDLVIQGHSHLVTRTYPMKNGEIVTKQSPDLITKGCGTVYTSIGSTATNHDSLGNPNVEEMLTILTPDIQQPAYTVVSVEGNQLTMTIKQANGLILDTFTIVGEDDSTSSGENQEVEKDPQTDASNGEITTNAPAESEPLPSGQATGGGCASVVDLSASVAMLVTVGAGLSFKKKKTRKQ